MSFRSSNINYKEDPFNKGSQKVNVELTPQELEFLLVTIKNGLFKGEYVELLYNLTLKLQNHFKDIKFNK